MKGSHGVFYSFTVNSLKIQFPQKKLHKKGYQLHALEIHRKVIKTHLLCHLFNIKLHKC